jgi:hypothetical protein
MAADPRTLAAVDEPEPELADVVVVMHLDLQLRRGRAGKVAEEAVGAMQAKVVAAGVGQRDPELVAGVRSCSCRAPRRSSAIVPGGEHPACRGS